MLLIDAQNIFYEKSNYQGVIIRVWGNKLYAGTENKGGETIVNDRREINAESVYDTKDIIFDNVFQDRMKNL